MNSTEATANAEKCASGLAGDGLTEVSKQEGRASGGPPCSFAWKKLNKAKAFWARKEAMRRQPGHCGRCGKPSETRTCQRCREYSQKYKAELKAVPASVAAPMLTTLLRRVESLEIAVANLQLRQGAAYARGYKAGQKNRRRRIVRRIEGLRGEHSEHRSNEQVSLEELSQINHAYRRAE